MGEWKYSFTTPDPSTVWRLSGQLHVRVTSHTKKRSRLFSCREARRFLMQTYRLVPSRACCRSPYYRAWLYRLVIPRNK
ncbi:hypothetical protein B7P43_G14809 [Cryptotermes secundus]|uniref:Uncharacterized protein n=1 Tax=Cryptotermes secundus TaxID=105785 RepID=A0A2J7QEC2_9NEOP|nr:hypothetical protein B7P43_G14809 [Cryptotermes secundus]